MQWQKILPTSSSLMNDGKINTRNDNGGFQSVEGKSIPHLEGKRNWTAEERCVRCY